MSARSTRPRIATVDRTRRAAALIAASAAPLLGPMLALAAEEAGGHGEHHAPNPAGLVFPFINFGIYAFLMYRFAWPAIRTWLADRRSNVVTALESARTAREEAEALKAEYETKLRNLEADAARAREEVLANARLEAKNLVDQARQSAERIRNDARLVADHEVSRAKRELQEESAALVARLAAEIVSRQLTDADQSRFVAEFVADAKSGAEGVRR